MQHSSKLNAVESIRGLACLAVVFSHLSLSFIRIYIILTTMIRPQMRWSIGFIIHRLRFGIRELRRFMFFRAERIYLILCDWQ